MEICAEAQKDLLSYHMEKNAELLTVCGVFSSSFYLESLENAVYLLHDRAYGLLPFGFASTDTNALMKHLMLRTGMKAIWEGDILTVPDAELILRLKEGRLWRAGSSEAIPAGAECIKKAIRLLEDSAKSAVAELVTRPECEPQSIYARIAAPYIRDLKSALLKNSEEIATQAISGLIGLGPGLTPSMDDFLTGAMSVLYYAKECWNQDVPGLEALSCAICKFAALRTCIFSRPYLVAAAQGKHFSIIDDVMENFSQSAVNVLLSVGGHSGGDMLTGMLWAILNIL